MKAANQAMAYFLSCVFTEAEADQFAEQHWQAPSAVPKLPTIFPSHPSTTSLDQPWS